MDTKFIITKELLQSIEGFEATTRLSVPLYTPNPHDIYFRVDVKCECCGFVIGHVLFRDFGEYALMIWDKACDQDIVKVGKYDIRVAKFNDLPDDGAAIADLTTGRLGATWLQMASMFRTGILKAPLLSQWATSRFDAWRSLSRTNFEGGAFCLDEHRDVFDFMSGLGLGPVSVCTGKDKTMLTCGNPIKSGCGALVIFSDDYSFTSGEFCS